MNKKLIALLTALFTLGALLAACTPETIIETVVVEKEGPTVVETVVVEKEGETIVETVVVEVEAPPAEKSAVTLWLPDSDRWRCTAETLVPEFNGLSDSVEVDVSLKAAYMDAVRPALAGGVGPDIFQTEGVDAAAEMANAGLLYALDGFVAAYDWDQRLAPWALDLGKGPDGQIYTIPAEQETLVLFYNKTVFEEKGWDPPETLAELEALADQVAAEGLIPFAGVGLPCVGCSRWYTGEFLNSVAGPDKVYQGLRGEIPWTDQAFVDSIALFNDWVQKGWFMGSPEDFLAADADTYMSAFDAGEVVMNIEGTWFYGRVRDGAYFGPDSNSDWDWVAMPTESGEDIFTLGLGSTWSVNANIENPKAVGEFLDWYLSPEIQGKQFGECGTTPAPVPVTQEMMEGVDPRLAAIFASLNEASAAGNYGYTWWTFWPAKTNNFAKEEIQKVWTGDMTPEEYLAGLNEVFAEELADGDMPAIPER